MALSLGSLVTLLSLGTGVVCLHGCGGTSRACATPTACGEGKTCVAGQCRDAKQAPAPQSAQRVVLDPIDVAVVSSTGLRELDRANVSFGRNSLGEVAVLLRFPAPFTDTTQILSAHLVMVPATGSIAGPAPVKLRLARILEPWTPQEARWATLPRLSAIESTFLASTWGNRPLRLDVTPQVRRWREHRPEDHGLAVLASPQNHTGETYSLGLTGGHAPRLDVYLR